MSEPSTGAYWPESSSGEACVGAAEAAAGEDHSSNIFTIPDLDMVLATWCMISLIVFTVLFELSLHKIEHQLRTHTHYLKILSKVYKELMILGFISFAILIVLQCFHLAESAVETLEFVHLWFFFIAVLYAIHVLVYMWLARRDKRRYDVATYMRIPDMVEGLKQAQARQAADSEDQSLLARTKRAIYRATQFAFVSSVASSIYQPKETQLYQQIQFHIVRSLFIRTYDLSPDFDFAKYLRRCMSKHITEQLDIKETSWMMLVLFLLINVARVEIETRYGTTDYALITLWLFLVVPYFLLGVSCIAVVGIEHAKKELMKKVGVEKIDDLEQALLRSRAKMGNVNRGNHRQSILIPQRASITSIDQQTALNAYLPLLLQGLFPYNRPNLFPKVLEVAMLTQCFFIGLAFIFHIRQAFESFSMGIAVAYVVFTMLPHLIVLLVVAPHVMTTYVFVHSVGYVNKEVLQHVSEFMAESAELKNEIQDYLQQYAIKERITAADLFLKLSDGDAVLYGSSLQQSLHHVNIHLNKSQVNRLCRMINLEQNGKIDLREFSLFFFGSEGSATLSLIPINKNTKGQLAMVAESNANHSMEQEIRVKAINDTKQQLAKQQHHDSKNEMAIIGTSDIVLVVGDENQQPATDAKSGGDFHPNALHDPSESRHSPVFVSHPPPVHRANTVVSQSMAVSHSRVSPPRSPKTPSSARPASSSTHTRVQPSLPMPGLDLRHTGIGANKHHGDVNVFISSTLDQGHGHHHHHANSAPNHSHGHGHGHAGNKANKQAMIGNDAVDWLDFASCFHGAEALCQRCAQPVLVTKINDHVRQCRPRGGLAQSPMSATDMDRISRTASVPFQHQQTSDDTDVVLSSGPKAMHARKNSRERIGATDDLALSKTGSRRATGRLSRLKPLSLVTNASTGLIAVNESDIIGAEIGAFCDNGTQLISGPLQQSSSSTSLSTAAEVAEVLKGGHKKTNSVSVTARREGALIRGRRRGSAVALSEY